ncbi:MAG: hypothetical protein PHE51_05405 [Eubacteriales bacterium]|nr:hypothetical protein [Eubacteriales bacterium]
MKKFIALLITCFMLVTCIPVMAETYEATTAQPSWTLIAGADFNSEGLTVDLNGDGNIDVEDLSSTGIVSWTHNPANLIDTSMSLGDGLYIGARADKVNAVRGILATPIDTTTDADYYVVYTSNFNGGGKQTNGFTFKREKTYFNTKDNRDELKIDTLSFNATDSGAGKWSDTGYSYQAKNPATMGDYAWGGNKKTSNLTSGYPVASGSIQTMVGQISFRSGVIFQRSRIFTADQTPTFAPDYWDTTIINAPTWRNGDTADKSFDILDLTYSGNSGHITGPTIYGFKLYKAPAVNAYSMHSNDAKSLVPYIGSTINMTGNAAIIDNVKWYSVQEGVDTEIATGTSYVVPDSMLNKYLKAVVTTTSGEEYEAISGIVHAPIEVNELKATVTSATGFNQNDFATYNKATKITFTATIKRHGNAAPKNTYALITAQYDKDGTLKGVMTSKANNKLSDVFAGEIKGTEDNKNWKHNVFTFDHVNMNYAAGDYFKSYIWMSNIEVANGFVYDSIKPITINGERVIPVVSDVFTIPNAQ